MNQIKNTNIKMINKNTGEIKAGFLSNQTDEVSDQDGNIFDNSWSVYLSASDINYLKKLLAAFSVLAVFAGYILFKLGS